MCEKEQFTVNQNYQQLQPINTGRKTSKSHTARFSKRLKNRHCVGSEPLGLQGRIQFGLH